MTQQDVRPLFEDPSASSELRSFVALARGDGPSEADLQRLATRLAPVLGASAGVAVGAGAAKLGTPPAELPAALPALGAAKAGLFGKLLGSSSGRLLALGLMAGVGAGFWMYTGSSPRLARAPVEEPVSVAPAPSMAAVREPKAAPPPVAQAPAAAPAIIAPAAPVAANDMQPARRHAARVRAVRSVSVATEPLRPVEVQAPVATVTAPEPARPSELSLIQRAEAARGRPAEALAVLDTHQRLYPQGNLAQEREVLAIELLLKVGQSAQARSRAAQFQERYPSSAHLPRVRALLARSVNE
jgi:hypothetical protein